MEYYMSVFHPLPCVFGCNHRGLANLGWRPKGPRTEEIIICYTSLQRPRSIVGVKARIINSNVLLCGLIQNFLECKMTTSNVQLSL